MLSHTSPILELKPNKDVYIWYRLIQKVLGTLVSVLISGFIAIVLRDSVGIFIALVISGFSIVSTIISFFNLQVAYKKQVYLFYEDRIVRKSGSLFFDQQSELKIKNITFIDEKLPFLENKFFGTGTLIIESAGSKLVEIGLSSIDNPRLVYEKVTELMVKNGFTLSQNETIQEESPHTFGVLLEVFGNILAALFSVFFFLLFVGLQVVAALSDINQNFAIGTVVLFVMAALMSIPIWVIVRYMDISKRSYKVYRDTIYYEKGFLTKHRVLLPFENLSDSFTSQSTIQKLFGIYDVKISSRGSGKEITFAHMANGEIMEKNIDMLIQENEQNISRASKETPKTHIASGTSEIASSQADSGPVLERSYDMEMQASFKPHLLSMLFKYVVIIVLLICISTSFVVIAPTAILMMCIIVISFSGAFLKQFLDWYATDYKVMPGSIREEYNLLQTKNKDFSVSKISYVEFYQDVWGRLLNTFSVNFGSIGSTDSIQFKHLPDASNNRDFFRKKFSFDSEKETFAKNINVNLVVLLFDHLPLIIIGLSVLILSLFFSLFVDNVVLILLLTIVFLVVIFTPIVYLAEYLSYRDAKVTIYKTYFHYSHGFLRKKDYYVPLEYLKNVSFKKYPFYNTGTLKLDITGEYLAKQSNSNNYIVKNRSVDLKYVDNLVELADLFDYAIMKNGDVDGFDTWNQEILKVSKPMLTNFVLNPFSFILLFVPPLQLFWISSVLGTLKTRYELQTDRVVAWSGIFYRSRLTVLYTQIDHTKKMQGPLNKLFGNGTLDVHTEGSGSVEMRIQNIPDWVEFYDELSHLYDNSLH